MKSLNQKIAITLAVLGVSAINTGCGNGPMPAAVAPAPASAIPVGSACLINLGTGQTPILGFTGSNIVLNSNTLLGGSIPMSDNSRDEFGNPGLSNGGKTYGTMNLMGAGAMTQGHLTGQGVDGNISLNITSFMQQGVQGGMSNTTSNWNMYTSGVYGNGQGYLATVTGAIQISQSKYDYLRTKFGMVNYGSMNYGNMPMVQPQAQPQLCFSGIAISMSVAPSLNRLYGGRVYLNRGAVTGQLPGTPGVTSSDPISLQW